MDEDNTPHGDSETAQTTTNSSFSGVSGEGEHRVGQRESIASIAKQTGHYWKTIWENQENAMLRESRGNPNVLLPGDRLHIPEIDPISMDCSTEQLHRFRRRGEPSTIKVVFQIKGEPRANEPYNATIDGRHYSGTLDEEGKMTLHIPSDSRDGRVIIGEGDSADRYELQLHQLNPSDHQSGLQQRLKNLGYPCEVSGEIDEQTHVALGDFRKRHQEPVSGQCNDAVKQQITTEHRDA